MAKNKGLIVGFDIKDYSSSKTEAEQQRKRDELQSILEKSIFSSFIDTKDTGDGIYVFIDSSNIYEYIKELNNIEREVNLNNEITIRFRAAVHFGTYSKTSALLKPNQTDFVGTALTETARFLDADCLKQLLAMNNNTKFVFGISHEVFSIILDDEPIDKYSKYYCKVKTFSDYIWLKTEGLNNLPECEKIQDECISQLNLTENFNKELLRAEFVHKFYGVTSDLSTFYVPLECNPISEDKDIKKIGTDTIIQNYLKNPKNLVFSGEEQSGKTGFCKNFFKSIFESKQFIPILISLKEKEFGKLENIIEKKIKEEFAVPSIPENCIKIVFIDNFNLLTKKYQENYISFLKNQKNFFFILTVDSMYFNIVENKKRLEGFDSYRLRECGNKVRGQLIERWIDFTDIKDLNYKKKDELSQYLTNTFIKGVIPFTPLYILTVLQAKDLYTDETITSKGHCYQALVYCALRKTNVPDLKIGAYITILSNIAYYFYSKSRTGISEDEFNEFFNQLSEKFNISFEYEEFKENISNASIFDNSSGNYEFVAPYLYYYFVSKYIADKINRGDSNIEQVYTNLYSNLQDKANAYIAIFLIHHTKNRKVLNYILDQTKLLYSNYPETILTNNEIKHIDNYCEKLYDLVITSQDESSKNRNNHDEEKDREELDEEDYENSKIIEEMNKALRTTDVLGQIIKNTQGEIEKKDIEKAYIELEKVYMRICNMFLTEIQRHEKDFLDIIMQRIEDISDKPLERKVLSETAYRIIGEFYFMSIYSSIKRTANCLGSTELTKIAKNIAYENKNPFKLCSYFQTVLWYEKRVPLDEMKSEMKEFSPTIRQLCRVLLVEYTDFHHVDTKHKQQISETFDIPIKKLNLDSSK